jgi:hypothetical protein
MTTHARLLGIVVAVSWLGLSAASAAGGTSKDTWKGTWKFEIELSPSAQALFDHLAAPA